MMPLPTRSRAAARLIALAAVAAAACPAAPAAWSPDGRWIAYTTPARPVERTLPPGWLFDASGPPPRADLAAKPTSYRLWATRSDGSESVLIDECPGPITAPGWSPDGSALAFGRLVPLDDGMARFEVVVQEGLHDRRVVATAAVRDRGPDPEALAGQVVAWSPAADPKLLAVPQVDPPGLAVIRADNGRLIKSIDDAYLPAWSPDGGKLAFLRGGEPDGLYVLDMNSGSPRFLVDVGPATQAPAWSRDGNSLWVPGRDRALRPGTPVAARADVLRVRLDLPIVEIVQPTGDDPALGGRPPRRACFGADREFENIFSAVDAGGDIQLTWYARTRKEVVERFHPVDFAVPVGSLALSPDGKVLALRAGQPGRETPPALYDPAGRRTILVAPDDSARLDWIAALIAAARAVAAAPAEPTATPGLRTARPTLLPAPGDYPAGSLPFARLARIGRLGRALCDRPADAPPASPAVAAALDEARVAFDDLRGDHAAAAAGLPALVARATSSEQRFRLEGLRAQAAAAGGDLDSAIRAATALSRFEPPPSRRVEYAGERPFLGPESSTPRGWPAYLAARFRATQKDSKPAAAEGENGEIPDAPPAPDGLGIIGGFPREILPREVRGGIPPAPAPPEPRRIRRPAPDAPPAVPKSTPLPKAVRPPAPPPPPR